jgi:hypothetical protein
MSPSNYAYHPCDIPPTKAKQIKGGFSMYLLSRFNLTQPTILDFLPLCCCRSMITHTPLHRTTKNMIQEIQIRAAEALVSCRVCFVGLFDFFRDVVSLVSPFHFTFVL